MGDARELTAGEMQELARWATICGDQDVAMCDEAVHSLSQKDEKQLAALKAQAVPSVLKDMETLARLRGCREAALPVIVRAGEHYMAGVFYAREARALCLIADSMNANGTALKAAELLCQAASYGAVPQY